MIERLILQNVQSHKNSEFTFHKGVNVIVGPTDGGKSAVIRALKKLIQNRPLGSEMRSWWKNSEMFIQAYTDDNYTITYTDDGREKQYDLNELTFKAFGTSVPEEIQQALNISEINLQSQLDSHFLLSQSAGEVAQHFNRIAHLDKIDTGLQNIQRWIREISANISYKTEQLKQQETELSKFNYLERFEIEVEVLEEMERKRLIKQQKQLKLKSLISQLQKIDLELEEYSEILKADFILTDVLKKTEEKKQLNKNFRELNLLVNDIKATNTEIEETRNLLSLDGKITKIQKLIQTKENIQTKKVRLEQALKSINSINKKLEDSNVLWIVTKKEFEANMGNTCILCGTKLK
jgi:exonuclease SbcC